MRLISRSVVIETGRNASSRTGRLVDENRPARVHATRRPRDAYSLPPSRSTIQNDSSFSFLLFLSFIFQFSSRRPCFERKSESVVLVIERRQRSEMIARQRARIDVREEGKRERERQTDGRTERQRKRKIRRNAIGAQCVLTVRCRVASNNARALTLLFFATCVHGSFVVRVDDRAVYCKTTTEITRVRFDPREGYSTSGNV